MVQSNSSNLEIPRLEKLHPQQWAESCSAFVRYQWAHSASYLFRFMSIYCASRVKSAVSWCIQSLYGRSSSPARCYPIQASRIEASGPGTHRTCCSAGTCYNFLQKGWTSALHRPSRVKRILDGEQPIEVWREFNGMTQEMLARKSGISKPYISQLERGKRLGRADVLKSIAAALNLAVDDLLR